MDWLTVLLLWIVAGLVVAVIGLHSALRRMDDRLAHTHAVAHTAIEVLSAHLSGKPVEINITRIPLRKDDKE